MMRSSLKLRAIRTHSRGHQDAFVIDGPTGDSGPDDPLTGRRAPSSRNDEQDTRHSGEQDDQGQAAEDARDPQSSEDQE